MTTQILHVKPALSLNVRNTCTLRGQICAFYRHAGKFLVDKNINHVNGNDEGEYEQFIVWTDSLISFKPRQSNDVYNDQQSVMTVEQMKSICDILNSVDTDDITNIEVSVDVADDGSINLAHQEDTRDNQQDEDEDEIVLIDEKMPRRLQKQMVKTNNVRYGLAGYEFVKELYKSDKPCFLFLTYNEWMVYKAIVRSMEKQRKDVIHASDVVRGNHAIAGTISTLNMKGFVRCRVGGRGYISAVTTKNYNDFNQ